MGHFCTPIHKYSEPVIERIVEDTLHTTPEQATHWSTRTMAEHALVFCVDEKSQIQALDRPQPGLPMKKGRAGTMTHDYKRHGTTTLFAALNVFEGTVIGKCYQRHRHTEYLRFLREIDRMTPQGLDVHLIVDNYSAHKHERVKKWLARHPHFNVHFIPTSSSWLNLVERFFREITARALLQT